MVYTIRTVMLEAGEDGLLPPIDLAGWRVVAVLEGTQVRHGPDKWYVTVLVEAA